MLMQDTPKASKGAKKRPATAKSTGKRGKAAAAEDEKEQEDADDEDDDEEAGKKKQKKVWHASCLTHYLCIPAGASAF